MLVDVIEDAVPAAVAERAHAAGLPLRRLSVQLRARDYRDVRFHFVGIPVRSRPEAETDEIGLPIMGIADDITLQVVMIVAAHRKSPVVYEVAFGDVDSEEFVVKKGVPLTKKALESAHHAKLLVGALVNKMTLRGRPDEGQRQALNRLLEADSRRSPYDSRDRATFARLLDGVLSLEGVDKLRRRAGLRRLSDLGEPAKIANLVQSESPPNQ